MSLRERFYRRQRLTTCIQSFLNGLLGMSIANAIFGGIAQGFIAFQIFGLISQSYNNVLTYFINLKRERKLELQKAVLKHYKKIKIFLVITEVISLGVFCVYGLKVFFLLGYIALIIRPLTVIMNNLESTASEVIMETGTDSNSKSFVWANVGILSSYSGMAGTLISILVLNHFQWNGFPFVIAIVIQSIAELINTIEVSRYIEADRGRINTYLDENIEKQRQERLKNELENPPIPFKVKVRNVFTFKRQSKVNQIG